MKKIILIIVTLIFLTGCEVKYDLVITDKETVKESFNVYVDNNEIYKSGVTIQEYLDYYSHLYLENEGYENFVVKGIEDKNVSRFLVKRNYSNLDDYIKSYSFKNLFNTASIERIGSYISFTTSNNTYLESIKNDEILSENNENYTYEINIKFYNEVVNHNADKIDEKNNIYTWTIDKNTIKNNIYFKIGPDVRYDVVIKDYIQNNIITISLIGGLLIILILFCGYVYVKIKKNNEID